MVGHLRPLLPYTAVAVVVMLASGLTMLLQLGLRTAPIGWHIMLTLGVVMAIIFGYVYWALYPKLRDRCRAADWPAAAQALNRIRQLVGDQSPAGRLHHHCRDVISLRRCMKIVGPRRATRSYTQKLVAAPEAVFPLLCPVREADWIAGWDPLLVVSGSGVAERDCVFTTAASPADAIWYITATSLTPVSSRC